MCAAFRRSQVYLNVEDILESYILIIESIDYYMRVMEKMREELELSSFTSLACKLIKIQASDSSNSIITPILNQVSKLIQLERKINKKRQEIDTIIKFMECLKDVPDQDQLEVIKLRYVEGLRTCDIAERWNKDSRIVRRKKEKAILNLLKVYNKRGEEFGFK
ncbi:hypothetical protein SAMN02745751_03169 [Dethiosulfatibacter aminovorans DSM 17477]|uniref:Uncharacterized protein n=1 Tax=Dethiosulfatibacter aminovorans DSM 17477 TaxID=1121476 RepID=A0A1M6LGZ6_9FIRM|nr:hypothetical protein [Dethiosulfatibacter aminovorans]SHJ70408.1 hypothetical protein SAMN02745751_03169 [Dethiosulfatibacter aminovorans DSM 17477]